MTIHSRPAPAFALSLLLLASGVAAAPPLPGLAANTSEVTVSGISSGAYMAVQFQVAYSSLVRGAGILAGGPYYCAKDSVNRALGNCMEPVGKEAPPSADETLKTVRQLAESGKIDPLKDLRDDRVWLLSGGQDKTVDTVVMDSLAAFYRTTLPESAIRYVKLPDAGHAMISVADPKANACDTSKPPFINRCQDFDAAGQLLSHLLGPLQPAAAPPAGEIIAFDQAPFIKGLPIDASLAKEGYAFVPTSCRGGGCRVHVAFHGCRQSAGEIGRRFVEGAGYNGWAASNRLIVLYPQTTTRNGFAFWSFKWLLNPKGCWDWWGYSGSDYHTRDGLQMHAVRAMIDGLGAPAKP
ncbi:PHB depolymerase family esterase [Dechloromonas denitrificans]|uniref:extracellular catalytic domain type 2 short-chain-length polyhydroxyalkanoate depolymerase n=1 Tax=Dechloromonas denitrificans TaxID=281362 RepID=UPI001CFB5BDD|nr:PHB depolymerase family esterase [Dechloromonas denitrificans]UCV06297.1 poly(3-hydroxybutyrate) depolymerase [Dechloromonas denitrificans]